ncbi:MAG: GNAT family N-acetyltransferase [Patescibacteria group bacterium]
MKTKTFIGKKITIRKISKNDLRNAKKLQDFINSFVDEDAQIMMNEKVLLEEERKWLKAKLESIKKRKAVFLIAEHNNTVAGTTGIDSGIWRQSHVGNFGITIKKGYRGIGLGTYLIEEIIKLAKKELKPKPKIIRLDVFPTNKPAIRLYRKCGFKKVAKIPRQIYFKGKLHDEIIMLLYLRERFVS